MDEELHSLLTRVAAGWRGGGAVGLLGFDRRAARRLAGLWPGARRLGPGQEARRLERGERFDLLVWGDPAPAALEAARLGRVRWGCRHLLVLGGHGDPEDSLRLQGLGAAVLGRRVLGDGTSLLLVEGQRSEPVLRVDDYPTGVRPLLPDLSPIHRVLESIDGCGLRFHLGIVPALLEPGMLRFLRGLRHLVPVVHGYDHAYPRFSGRLAAVDPLNQRGTVRSFNEFAGQDPAQVLRKLVEARQILEDGLGVAVTGYIPPCNRGDRATGRALAEAGYTHTFSEKRIPACPLALVRSDFYGRSSTWDAAARPEVITLHATWEFDQQREGDAASLGRLLGDLARRQVEERSRSAELALRLFAGPADLSAGP
jgi:hypothetical protein